MPTPLRFEKSDGRVTRTFDRHLVEERPDGWVLAGSPADLDHWDDGTTPAGWSVTWVPVGRDWVATWFRTADGIGFYGDVGIVVERTVDRVVVLDLDLDVVGADGAYRIVDQDEFAENRLALRYPDDVVERAVRAADELLGLVVAPGPLDAVGRALLDRWSTPPS